MTRQTLGRLTDPLDVLMIGAGQAGLALGCHLRERGMSFLLVEAAPEIGHVWRSRWDSLKLFTPVEYDSLPGQQFYAETASETTETVTARHVVVATGPFQAPYTPETSSGFAPEVVQLHSVDYRRPDQLPDGPVLVVGGGNSGLQIAADLASSRSVTIAIGTRPPMLPQRLLGRDLFWWLSRLGIMSMPADSRLARRIRSRGDPVIGTRIRHLQRQGVAMRPRLVSASDKTATFVDATTLDVAGVVWATGFRGDYEWVDIPGVLTANGEPRHRCGITDVPGLAFLGIPWQRSRGSALLGFVQHDAAWLVDHLDQRQSGAFPKPPR